MHIVVTVRDDPFRGLTVDAFGPWELDKCERERTRLLAHADDPFAPVRHRMYAQVVPVRDEVAAP